MSEEHRPTEGDVAEQRFDWHLFLRLFRFVTPYWAYLVGSLTLLVLYTAVRIGQPYVIKVAIDQYVAQKDLDGLDRMALVYLGLAIAGFLFRYFQTMTTQIVGQRAMHDLRLALFSRIQLQDGAFFDRQPVGRIITRVINDLETVTELFSSGLVALLGDVLVLVGIVVAMVLLEPKLAFAALLTLPFLVYATGRYRRKSRENFRENRLVLGDLNAHLQESIAGMGTIQALSQEERNFERFLVLNTKQRDNLLKSIHFSAVFYPLVELFSAISIGITLWYGSQLILGAALLKGVVIAFLQYIERMFAPIRDLAEKYAIMQSAMASSERIFELLDEPIRVPLPAKPRYPKRVEGHIEFRNVHMSYLTGKPVLRGVSFSIEPGQKAAIVGPTGSGKTSLVSALLRFYELDSGQILVDGIDIREWDPSLLRRSVSLVSQDLFLFSGTVSENISLRDPSLTGSRVRLASVEMRAHAFIENLPKAYDALLTERGSTLSQGQRQLLCFARALAFDSKILVLDEATSSVDPETERLVQQALGRLLVNRTALIIAHRLGTIEFADKILVLRNGRIQEEGTHVGLLENPSSLYARLYGAERGNEGLKGNQK